jgi:hypothetical protein
LFSCLWLLRVKFYGHFLFGCACSCLAGSAVVHLKSQNTKKGQNIQSVPPGRANKSFKPTALRATIGIGGVATSSAFLTAAVLGRGLTPAL